MGLILKALKGAGNLSEKIVTGGGNKIIHGASALGKGTGKLAKGVGNIITTDIAEEAMNDETLYGRLVGKTLNKGGIGLLTAGTLGFSTVNAIAGNGTEKLANLGYVEAGENLDRLISYDGSGFMNRINEVSGNDPEVLSDIVSNTFDEFGQSGANGSIVFALHNMREG